MVEDFQRLRVSLADFVTRTIDLPGPTGESNRLSIHGRGVMLCLGGASDDRRLALQILLSLSLGNTVVALRGQQPWLDQFCTQLYQGGIPQRALRIIDGFNIEELIHCKGISGVILEQMNSDARLYREIRKALAARAGEIIALIDDMQYWQSLVVERALCIDTTAAGGNTELLAAAS